MEAKKFKSTKLLILMAVFAVIFSGQSAWAQLATTSSPAATVNQAVGTNPLPGTIMQGEVYKEPLTWTGGTSPFNVSGDIPSWMMIVSDADTDPMTGSAYDGWYLVNVQDRPNQADADAGEYSATLYVEDSTTAQAYFYNSGSTLVFTVNDINEKPYLTNMTLSVNGGAATVWDGSSDHVMNQVLGTVAKGNSYKFEFDVVDPEGETVFTSPDNLVITIANQPGWAVWEDTDGDGIPSLLNDSNKPADASVGTYSSVKITVKDSGNAYSDITFNIDVQDVDDPPDISGTPTTSVDQAQFVGMTELVAAGDTFSFSPTVTDVDTDPVNFEYAVYVDSVPLDTNLHWLEVSVTNGVLTLQNQEGRPDNDDAGGSMSSQDYEIQICVSDSMSVPAAQRRATYDDCLDFTLTVNNLNDSPTIGIDAAPLPDPYTSFDQLIDSDLPVYPGEKFKYDPVIQDVDNSSTTPYEGLTLKVVNMPSWAQFSNVGEGIPSLVNKYNRPDNRDTSAGTGTGVYENVQICVTDSELGMDAPSEDWACIALSSITVNDVNEPPTISGTPTLVVDQTLDTAAAQGATYLFTPTIGDIDTAFESLDITTTNLPAWMVFVDHDSDGYPSLVNSEGRPNDADVGVYSGIQICVQDDSGLPAVCLPTFSITVNNVNDAPTIDVDSTPTPVDYTKVNEADTSALAGEVYKFKPAVQDLDESDVLTYKIVNQPIWANFDTAYDGGTIPTLYNKVGRPSNSDAYVETPTQQFSRTYGDVQICVTDSPDGIEAPSEDWVCIDPFDITVNNVNDAPEITGSPKTSVTQTTNPSAAAGSVYTFTATASDIDNTDAQLTFNIEGKPAWANFDTETGVLSNLEGRPNHADTNGGPNSDGVYPNVMISVSDGLAESVYLPTFQITVNDTNDPPTITNTAGGAAQPVTSIKYGEQYTFTVKVSDIDDGTFAVSTLDLALADKPSWLNYYDSANNKNPIEAPNPSEITFRGTPTPGANGQPDVWSFADVTFSVGDGDQLVELVWDINIIRPGDINCDGTVDMLDFIDAAKVAAGLAPVGEICLDGDVDGDGKIGVAELEFIIQKLAATR